MTFAEFVQIVRQMRLAQKRYFTSRAQEDLVAAKEAEKAVDEAIAFGVDQERLFS